jgi:hypothetical protein
MRQLLPTAQHLGDRDPKHPKGGGELVASPPASTGSVKRDGELAFGGQYSCREHSLRQQQAEKKQSA